MTDTPPPQADADADGGAGQPGAEWWDDPALPWRHQPTRQDIADITDLRFETISRIIKGLERSGVLVPVRVEGVRATRSYAVDPAVLNGLPAA